MMQQKNDRDTRILKILLPLAVLLSCVYLLKWGYRFGRWLHQFLTG